MVMRLLLGGATIITGLTAYVSYAVTRDLLLNSIKANVLENIQQSGNQVDKWLLTRKTEVQTLANTPTLRSMDWIRVGPFLKPELSRLSDFYFFGMIYPDGTYYNTKVDYATGENIRDRKHIQVALSGQNYVSDPVLSRTLETPIVAVTTPVYRGYSAEVDEQQVLGVLAGLIDIEHLRDVV